MRHLTRIGLAVLLAVLAGGCGKDRPLLAGGKPVRYWVEALRNSDAKLRKQAAFKLGNVGPSDPSALPALVGALKDGDAGVRREAILALLKCGPEAREAVPQLTELKQHDADGRVRTCAARALKALQDAP